MAFGYCTSLRGYIPDMSQGVYVLPFPDRRTAGTLLAERLTRSAIGDNWAERTVVLALPRGGVAVAKQVAIVLGVPLSVIVTRKIGYPRQPELGVGAIAEGLGTAIYDTGLLGRLSLSPADLAPVVAAQQAELARQVQVYRGGRPLPPMTGWCVIVVDDGLATGATARAALRSLRAAHAAYLVLAVPVAAPAAAAEMRAEADQVVILATPRRFRSVGQWYRVLRPAHRRRRAGAAGLKPDLDPKTRLGGVGAAHAAAALGRTLILVQATPRAVLLGPRHGVVQAFKPYRASSADTLGLTLPDLPLRLALAVRTEEEQQVLATARGSILPPPIRAGKHSRLPTYLRHGSITSTKMHQIVRYSRSSGS